MDGVCVSFFCPALCILGLIKACLSSHSISLEPYASGEESSASKKGKNTTGPPWDNKDETRPHKEGIEQAKWDFIVLSTEQAVAFLKYLKQL